jgi:siroheme synthase
MTDLYEAQSALNAGRNREASATALVVQAQYLERIAEALEIANQRAETPVAITQHITAPDMSNTERYDWIKRIRTTDGFSDAAQLLSDLEERTR